jgi:hypothetical protein
MSSIGRRTIDLPDQVTVTIWRLPDRLSVQTLRSMLNAELYVLAGATSSPSGECTGFGAYVGTSGALGQVMARSGVSLQQWAFRSGRLRPQVVVLINRPGRPMAPSARLLVESSLIRAISRGYTVLNSTSSAPRAGLVATRSQRLWAMHTAQRLAGVVLEQVFLPHPAAARGGTTRERLVRLLLDQRPARALDTRSRFCAWPPLPASTSRGSPQRSGPDGTAPPGSTRAPPAAQGFCAPTLVVGPSYTPRGA